MPRMQVLPCRWTLRAQRLLLSSALPGKMGQPHEQTQAPFPRPQSLWGQVEIFSRSRVPWPQRIWEALIPPPGCLPSAAERGPGGLSCCVPGITVMVPTEQLWGPTGRAEQGVLTAQQLHEACGLLKQFKLQSEMPGSLAHRAW